MSQFTKHRRRIPLLDVLRTVAMLFMFLHHIFYDLSMFDFIPSYLLHTLPIRSLSYLSGSLFICTSGISSCFSRNPIRRGAIILAYAYGITIITSLMGLPVRFGILHFFGCCMILYGLGKQYLDRMSSAFLPLLYLLGFLCSSYFTKNVTVSVPFLYPLGFTTATFYSSDYYPLLPWIFIYLLGVFLGRRLQAASALPFWLTRPLPKALTWPGAHSLPIYLLHQPVFYLIFLFLSKL